MYSSVCVGPVRKPHCWFSHDAAHILPYFSVLSNLGLKICGGCSLDGEELYGIFVKRVLPGGLADQDGKLIFVDLDKV